MAVTHRRALALKNPVHDRLRNLRLRAGIRAAHRSEPAGGDRRQGAGPQARQGQSAAAHRRDRLRHAERHRPGKRGHRRLRGREDAVSAHPAAADHRQHLRNQRRGIRRALAERLDAVDGVAAVEVNISCPNVKAGGVVFGVDPAAAGSVVEAVRQKHPQDRHRQAFPQRHGRHRRSPAARRQAGADALSLINTLTGMAIDIETRRPRLANITGGLSGPAIKPVALRMVWQVARATRVPVIGIGGIMTGRGRHRVLHRRRHGRSDRHRQLHQPARGAG
ncbi:MAG: hypothetical protein MZV70_08330 [Desulfobacterales bacterium]|nr:hypothetical protein [Desulfobacterales bacterium]